MSRNTEVVWDWSGLRPSPMVLTLIVTNVAAFAIELILIRLGVLGIDGSPLSLVPADVVRGWFWQVATSVLLHDPTSVGHLLGNMLFLWIFGTSLENEEGGRSLLRAFVVGGLAGSTAQMAIGATSLVLTGFLGGLVAGMWNAPALGASGAVMGVTFAWLARHYYEVMNFLFIGPVRGRTLMLVMVVVELLSMLSLGGTGWGAHLGGMLAGVILGFGWYRPDNFRARLRRRSLVRKGRAIENELRVIKGGKDKPQGRQGDEWIH